MPGAFIKTQVRVDRQQRQDLTQLGQRVAQALAVQLWIVAQREVLLGLAPVADQAQVRAGLGDFAGLAHAGMVEADEL